MNSVKQRAVAGVGASTRVATRMYVQEQLHVIQHTLSDLMLEVQNCFEER